MVKNGGGIWGELREEGSSKRRSPSSCNRQSAITYARHPYTHAEWWHGMALHQSPLKPVGIHLLGDDLIALLLNLYRLCFFFLLLSPAFSLLYVFPVLMMKDRKKKNVGENKRKELQIQSWWSIIDRECWSPFFFEMMITQIYSFSLLLFHRPTHIITFTHEAQGGLCTRERR